MTTQDRFAYDWALDHLDKTGVHFGPDDTIAEVGSLDALDGLALARRSGASLLIFEPDPINAPTCRDNIASQALNGPISFFQIALTDKTGSIDFFSVDPDLYSNRGVSGLHPVNFKRRRKDDPDRNRAPIHTKVSVEASRFDDLELDTPRLVAMDVQGAELEVLKGFGKQLEGVQAVIAEASLSRNYRGGSTFRQLKRFMVRQGFRFVASDKHPRDPARIPRRGLKATILRTHSGDFNVLFVRNQ